MVLFERNIGMEMNMIFVFFKMKREYIFILFG